MKTISLEYAQTLFGDLEAIKRGYLTDETLRDAQKLAEEVVTMPTFGKLGYLAAVGQPHQWWVENSRTYAELEQKSTYARAKKFNILLEITEHICFDEKVETIISRVRALKLMNQQKTEEYIALTGWLSLNQFIF